MAEISRQGSQRTLRKKGVPGKEVDEEYRRSYFSEETKTSPNQLNEKPAQIERITSDTWSTWSSASEASESPSRRSWRRSSKKLAHFNDTESVDEDINSKREWFKSWFGAYNETSFNMPAAIKGLEQFGFRVGSPPPSIGALRLAVQTIYEQLVKEKRLDKLEKSLHAKDQFKEEAIGTILQIYLVEKCEMEHYGAARLVTRLLEAAVDPAERQSELGFGYNLKQGKGVTKSIVNGLYRKMRLDMFRVEKIENRESNIFSTSTKLKFGVTSPVGAVNAGGEASIGVSKEASSSKLHKSKVQISRSITLNTGASLESLMENRLPEMDAIEPVPHLLQLLDSEADKGGDHSPGQSMYGAWKDFFDMYGTHIIVEEFYGLEKVKDRTNVERKDTVKAAAAAKIANVVEVDAETASSELKNSFNASSKTEGSEENPSRVSISIVPISHLLETENRERVQRRIDEYYHREVNIVLLDRITGNMYCVGAVENNVCKRLMYLGNRLGNERIYTQKGLPKNFTKLVVAEKCDSFGNLQLIQSVNGVEMFVEKSRKSLGLSFTRSMYQRLVYDNIGHFLYCQVQETSMFSKPRTVNYYLTFKKQRNKVTLAWTKHKSKAKQTILQALENNRYEADYDDEADWSACSEVTHTAEEDEVTLETGEEDQAYTPISSPHHRSQCPLPIEDSPCRYNSRHHSQSPLLVDISPRSHNLKNDPPVKSPDISPPCHQYHSPSNDSPNLSPLPSPTTPLAHNQFQSPPDSRSSPNHLVGNSPLSGCSSGLTDARGDGFQHLQNPTTSHKGTQADISPPDASAPEHPETCEYAETEPIQEPCQTTSMSDEDVPVDPVSAPGNLETRQDTEPKAIHEPCQRATMSYEGLPVDPVSAPGYLEARGCAETGPGHPLKAHTQLDPRIQSAPTRSNVSASVTLSSGFTSGLPEALLEIIRELLGKDAVDFLCAFKSRTSTRDSTQFRVTQSDFNRLERDFGKFAAECRKYGLVKKGRDPNTGKVFYYVYFKVLDTFLATQAKRTIQKAISSQSALVHLYSKPEGKVRKCMAKIEGFYSEVKDDFVVKYKDVSITVSGLDKIANAVRVFESVEHVRHPGGAKFANLTATYRNSLKVLNLVGQALDGSPFVYRHTNLYL